MKQLTKAELAVLPEGTRVVFVEDFDIFPEALVKAGTTGKIKENGFSEIWSSMLVEPDDPELREKLSEWGCIWLQGGEPGGEITDESWTELSPLALVDLTA